MDAALAFYVVGGEYRDTTFRELAKPDTVLGPFDEYEDAYFAWRARAMATVDQAYTRYQILENPPHELVKNARPVHGA